MQIPAHHQSIAKALALRSWVQQKDFPIGDYAVTIEGSIETLQRHLSDEAEGEIQDAQIVAMLAAAVDAERALLSHVLGKKIDIPGEAEWKAMCEAAGSGLRSQA